MTKHELYPIAEYCVRQGLKNTKDGLWSVPIQEIKKVFGLTYNGSKEQNEELYRELMSREEINELIMTEDCIEMTYHMEYCPECQQGGLAGAVSLLSVLGCNMSDEHDMKELDPSRFKGVYHMTKNELFIDKINQILKSVDFKKLDESCNSEDKSYARTILDRMHDALVEVYDTDYIDWSCGDFIYIPAVIRGEKSGHISLGLVNLDLQSSGEHWGTYIFTEKGVLDHGGKLSDAQNTMLNAEYIPYQYWYTAYLPDDHHVDFDNVPDDVKGIISSYLGEEISNASIEEGEQELA